MTARLFSDQYDQPLDTRTQVNRMPGTVDARCEAGKTETECRWPFCPCRFPDRYPEGATE